MVRLCEERDTASRDRWLRGIGIGTWSDPMSFCGENVPSTSVDVNNSDDMILTCLFQLRDMTDTTADIGLT